MTFMELSDIQRDAGNNEDISTPPIPGSQMDVSDIETKVERILHEMKTNERIDHFAKKM